MLLADKSDLFLMSIMRTKIPEPAEIKFKNMRFLITDRPTDSTMERFIKELEKRGAKDVVRVCEPTYGTEKLSEHGITVLDCQFDDGNPPTSEVMEAWFSLLKKRFKEEPGCCIAVHCVSGLGRAPVLVALALIESGMKFEDAVELIRDERRGAINAKQLYFLEHYRPKSRLKANNHKQCCIM